MRRLFITLSALAAVGAFAGGALAGVLTLRAPVELRSLPGRNHPVVVIAPADTDIVLLGEGGRWIPVELQGQRFYASAAALANAAPAAAPGGDPTCDYGYPYSGSGLFFARPLAQLRHSGPLGFLLGTHRYYPC